MALPMQPLDTWALASLLKTPYAPDNWLWDMLDDARKNPTPHRVVYDRQRNKALYAPPENFNWGLDEDCEWIVPGTLKDTSDL